MIKKTITLAVLACAAVFARADYLTQYEINLPGDANYEITNILMYEEYGASSSLTWPFTAYSPGDNILTNPFAKSEPMNGALLLGITHDLPNDAPGQKHIVLFMDVEAAQLANHIAWGTLFRNTLEDQLIADIELATSGQDWPIIMPGLQKVFDFCNSDAKTGILEPTGASHSTLFSVPGQFAMMSFSDGEILGYGQSSSIEVTPEPASMAALGIGALAMLRRRKRS